MSDNEFVEAEEAPEGKETPVEEKPPPPVSIEELEFYKRNRTLMRSNVTRNITKINDSLSSLSASECDGFIDVLVTCRNSLKDINDKVSRGLMYHEHKTHVQYMEIEGCDRYFCNIVGAIRKLEAQKMNCTQKIDSGNFKTSLPGKDNATPLRVPEQPVADSIFLGEPNNISINVDQFPNVNAPPFKFDSNVYNNSHTLPNFSNLNINQTPLANQSNSSSYTSQMKLPQVPLPVYGRLEGESLENFIFTFENIIGKYSLTEFEKFVLLSNQLRNEPLVLIKSLQGSQQSYSEAKALLIKAFSSPISQRFDIIERLSKIKLTELGDPYSFVSEMRIISHTFKALNIDMDTVLQFFFWHAMHDKLKTQFVHITNCNIPSLQQLEEHIFQAIERQKALMTKNVKHSDSIYGYAANVNYNRSPLSNYKQDNKPRACTLCSSSSYSAPHPIHKCEKFKTPNEKIEQIKKMGYCVKCANSTHQTNNCKFKFFKLCTNCGGKHFSYLCLSNSKPKYNREVLQNKSVIVKFDIFSTRVSNTSILPTFTAKIGSNKVIRVLRDSGAQTSFIDAKVAKRQNLKILRKINLTLNGFNTAVNYDTDVVEVILKLNNESHTIEVVCVPGISTELNLPGLKTLANSIVQKGYKLADEQLVLSDEIKNIEMILGANALYCLPEENITFGINGIYSNTSIGMLLFGDLGNLKVNLDYLSPKNERDICINDDELCLVDEDCSCEKFDYSDYLCENLNINTINFEFCITDEKGNIKQSELQKAANSLIFDSPDDVLNEKCINFLNYDCSDPSEHKYETNDDLIKYTLDNTSRSENGRLVMPLLWDHNFSDYISSNFGLSKQILKSNIKKLSKDRDRLLMVDQVFSEQLDLGIISKIDDLPKFMKDNPKCSFLGHMPIFKLNRDTTKCRVVFLSNICEKFNSNSVSHNMAMHPGPSLNRKISTAVTLMRFDKKIVTYDIVKAFLAIELYPKDSEKLCFLWVNDATNGDNSVIGYKMNRLMFGLRCSPAILMLALYHILIVESESDPTRLSNLKRSMYNMLYMDNGAIGANNTDDLIWAFNNLKNIFSPYKIELQQFVTNDPVLQSIISKDNLGGVDVEQKLLGMLWNTSTDHLYTNKLQLDSHANTKRKILKSIATNFDIFHINGPLLNRARIFMHNLQTRSKLEWDDEISTEELKFWHNISNQVNNSQIVSIPRFIGNREDPYELHVFTDSSKVMFGAVVYLYNVIELKSNFIAGKNKIIGSKLSVKSIPALELHGILFGVETVLDIFHELSSGECVLPINITNIKLFSDSLVCLNWIQNYSYKLQKMNKINVFVMNRLEKIVKLCSIKAIEFNYVSGAQNPADAITRAMSYKQFVKTNYLVSLTNEELNSLDNGDFPKVLVPNTMVNMNAFCCTLDNSSRFEPIIKFESYSSWSKLINVGKVVLRFINVLKLKLKMRDEIKYRSLSVIPCTDILMKATRILILQDQMLHFSDIFSYFDQKIKTLKGMPPLISQLNIFKDKYGILRVKSKLQRWYEQQKERDYPILLSKNSDLAKLIILDAHNKLSHSGLYTTLKELRKSYWIIRGFSVVKKILKTCLHCRRFNNRTFKLSQSPYRSFRVSPSNVPFRYIFIDHLGPYTINYNGSKLKIYVLIFSCLWSRAINLQTCRDLSTGEFLRGFQSHVFKHGVPEFCSSDLGSSIVSGTRTLTDLLSATDVVNYLRENGINSISFTQYPKGCKELGGLVESCVKLTKRIISGSVKNNVLDYFDFNFLIEKANSIVNKRPIAFKSAIRSNDADGFVPTAITPESLIYGREIPSLTLLPNLKEDIDVKDLTYDPKNLHSHIRESHLKISKCHKTLIELYNEEFVQTLACQATDKLGRYLPVNKKLIEVGDLVLLKEMYCKPGNYPLGRIQSTVKNCLQEVTEVIVMRGRTREILHRHVTSLIPFLKYSEYCTNEDLSRIADKRPTANNEIKTSRPSRKAAEKCRESIRGLLKNNHV